MEMVRLALNAMNTRFELVLQGGNAASLRASGEEALHEISRLEELLSAFKPASEIAHVNARAAGEAVRVSSEVFDLLLRARELWEQCDRTLDITVGPLMRCWGFWGAGGNRPDEAEIEKALTRVGFQHVMLDASDRTVRFNRRGMTIDLGAIGKGYAIDQAMELLRESGVRSALLHGGTSSAAAIGRPLDGSTWRTAIDLRLSRLHSAPEGLATVELCDNAIGVSAVSEKSFTVDGHTYGHVIDPRTGLPVKEAVLAAVVTPSATLSDALSTALMVLGVSGLEILQRIQPAFRGLVVRPDGVVNGVGMNQASP